MEGWIKLHRKLLESRYGKNCELVGFWSILLLSANHSDSFDSNGVKLSKGQLLTGRNVLSLKTGLSESKVERFLKKLEIEQQIEQQKFNKYRIISIVNWDCYQGCEQEIEQQANNKRTTSEQQVNTYKNVKNVKNEKNNSTNPSGAASKKNNFDLEAVYQHYPRKEGKTRGMQKMTKIVKTQRDYDNILQAVKNYARKCELEKTEKEFIKHFSSWVSVWQDYLEIDFPKPQKEKEYIELKYDFENF